MDLSPGDHPYLQTWGSGVGDSSLSSKEAEGRPGARTPSMHPHPEGGRPAYIHERRAPADASRLAAGSGAAAAGADPGRRRHPPAGEDPGGAHRRAQPHLRALRPARALGKASRGLARRAGGPDPVAPTRVSFCAAFRRSSLIWSQRLRHESRAPRGAPARSCSSRAGAESSRTRQPGGWGVRSA